MKKLFFTLALMLIGSFAFSSAELNPKINFENKIEKTDFKTIESITYLDDICSITIELYSNGELVGSGTYSDHTGDCDLARAGARLLAYNSIGLFP